MHRIVRGFCLALTVAIAGCGAKNATPAVAVLPPPSSIGTVPSAVTAANGYRVSVFAKPAGSTKPDSIVQIGNSVYVAFGDDLNPDGTPGPSGASNVQIEQFDLSGNLLKTYQVPGHNDGLMRFDDHTLWAMSNEDANAELVAIDLTSGTQHVYKPEPASLNASGGLPDGGGLDDMVRVNGVVYVSGSNPTVNATAPCPVGTSTPGCPNGVSVAPFAYALTLDPNGTTFALTPVATSSTSATDVVTNAAGMLNMTDPDSEAVSPDGTTLIVDSQQDSELALVRSPGSSPTVTYLPLTSSGAVTAVDDTRFVPSAATFLLVVDTSANMIYRVDATYVAGTAFSAEPTAVSQLNMGSGVLTPVVSGLGAPHGMAFITAQ